MRYVILAIITLLVGCVSKDTSDEWAREATSQVGVVDVEKQRELAFWKREFDACLRRSGYPNDVEEMQYCEGFVERTIMRVNEGH